MKYLVVCSFFLLLMSCNGSQSSGSSNAEVGSANLEGFAITKVPGTNSEVAIQKNPSGAKIAEGYLIDGKKNGIWITYHPNSDRIKTITSYVDNTLEGVHLELSNRGQIEAKVTYSQNEYNGPFVKYKFGRPLELSNYNMGKLDGVSKSYYNNGKLQKEIEFKNGIQDGIYKFYDDQGNTTLEYTYKNGEKVSGGIVTEEAQDE